jgi:hypothetical protein
LILNMTPELVLTQSMMRSLNQDCVLALGLKSMLLRDPAENPFSTASALRNAIPPRTLCPPRVLAGIEGT